MNINDLKKTVFTYNQALLEKIIDLITYINLSSSEQMKFTLDYVGDNKRSQDSKFIFENKLGNTIVFHLYNGNHNQFSISCNKTRYKTNFYEKPGYNLSLSRDSFVHLVLEGITKDINADE